MCFPADDNYESSALRSYPKARSPGSVYVLVMFDLCQLGTICFVFVFLITSVQVHRKRHGRSLTLTQLYQHISIYIACWSWPGCGYFICTLDSLFSYHFFFISYGRSSAECCFLDPVLSRTLWSSRRTKTNYVALFFWAVNQAKINPGSEYNGGVSAYAMINYPGTRFDSSTILRVQLNKPLSTHKASSICHLYPVLESLWYPFSNYSTKALSPLRFLPTSFITMKTMEAQLSMKEIRIYKASNNSR